MYIFCLIKLLDTTLSFQKIYLNNDFSKISFSC